MENKGVSIESSGESSKSPLRNQYLAEIEKIQQEFGSLEDMRLSLGLSQRKTCQLLLVDPSAWTRWNKSGAPPHIYQSLKWILMLKRTHPDAIVPSEVSQKMDLMHSKTQSKIESLEKTVQFLERSLYFLREKLDEKQKTPQPKSKKRQPAKKNIQRNLKKRKKKKNQLRNKKSLKNFRVQKVKILRKKNLVKKATVKTIANKHRKTSKKKTGLKKQRGRS